MLRGAAARAARIDLADSDCEAERLDLHCRLADDEPLADR